MKLKNNKSRLNCPLCNKKGKGLFDLKKIFLFQYPCKNYNKYKYNINTSLSFCSKCSHAYLSKIPSPLVIKNYYKNYYSNCTVSQKNIEFDHTIEANRNYKKEISKFKYKPSIVDVGGFDGSFVHNMRKITSNCLVIEPCKKAADLAKKRGFKVINDFLSKKITNKYKNKFDLLTARHVIEHLKNPRRFILELTNLVKKEGKIIIETPSLQQMFLTGSTIDIQLQHFHYFSLNSINSIIPKNWSIENVIIISDFNMLITISRNKKNDKKALLKKEELSLKKEKGTFLKKIKSSRNKLKKILQTWKRKKMRIWFWGASTTIGNLISIHDIEKNYFEGIIDSDTSKKFMRIPQVPDLQIVSPKKAKTKGVDAVLVTSIGGSKIIARTIKKLNWKIEHISLRDSKIILNKN